jgi:glycosyltransferase involved in cell wall biosynthesis
VLGYLACRRLPQTSFVTTHHGWIENTLSQKLFTRLALALTRTMDGVVCVASHLMDRLPSGVRNSGKAALIHNALVVQDYTPGNHRAQVRGELGVGEGATLIGVVGRLSEEKGCREALDAFRSLARRGEDVRLVFLGEGPLEQELRSAVDKGDLGNKVLFAGYRSPVQPWFEGLDLLLSPSRTEGLSNVLLEAQAFRLPVVATRVGGNGEIIRDGVTGILVPPERPDLQAAGLEQMLEDRALARSMAEAGYQVISEEFSFETRMRRMEAFYDRLPGTGR